MSLLCLSVLQENGEEGNDPRTAKVTSFESHSTQNIRTSLKRSSLESLEEEDGEDLISMLNFDFPYGCLDPIGDDKIEIGGFLKTDDDDDLDFII